MISSRRDWFHFVVVVVVVVLGWSGLDTILAFGTSFSYQRNTARTPTTTLRLDAVRVVSWNKSSREKTTKKQPTMSRRCVVLPSAGPNTFRNLTRSIEYAVVYDEDDEENDDPTNTNTPRSFASCFRRLETELSSIEDRPVRHKRTTKTNNNHNNNTPSSSIIVLKLLQRMIGYGWLWIRRRMDFSKKPKTTSPTFRIGGRKRHLGLLLACCWGGMGGLRPEYIAGGSSSNAGAVLYHERVVHSAYHDQVASTFSSVASSSRGTARTNVIELRSFQRYALRWILSKRKQQQQQQTE